MTCGNDETFKTFNSLCDAPRQTKRGNTNSHMISSYKSGYRLRNYLYTYLHYTTIIDHHVTLSPII